MLKSNVFVALRRVRFRDRRSSQTITIATLPPGSILHAQASVIAKVVQDHSKLQVRVVGYGGDTGILEAVSSKKADFWNLDVGESADAYHGRGTWKGNAKPNLRTGMTLFPFQMAFWVRKDSNINSLADLKGKRVPSEWVQQTGVIPHTTAVLAAGGLTYNDVVQRARGQRGARRRRLQGRQARPPLLRRRRAQGRGGRGLGRRPAPAADESAAGFREAHEGGAARVLLLDRQPRAAHRGHRQALAGADHRRGGRRRRARVRRGGAAVPQGDAREQEEPGRRPSELQRLPGKRDGEAAAEPAVPPGGDQVPQRSRLWKG